MRIMTRALAVAALTAMVGGVGISANAQTTPAAPPAANQGQMGGQMGGHHMTDPAEQLGKLKTEIGVTAAQTAAWDAYAKVVQDTAAKMKASHDGMNRHAFMEMSTADRLALLTKRRDTREQAHNAVKAAAEALLPVLDDTQKVRALMSLPGLSGPGPMMMKHHAMRKGPPTAAPTSVN
jgi:LTXXQ motif family protein